MDKKINYNSTENQNIKRDFVNREIYCNVNSMVEYILKKSYEDNDAPFSYEDLDTERYSYVGHHISFDSLTYPEKSDALEELCTLAERIECFGEYTIEGEENSFIYISSGCWSASDLDRVNEEIEDLENLDPEYIEVYEWWMVSGWLAEKLEEKGEVVISSECIWGRRTTGQAILLDGVISRICEDLNMLK